MPMLTFEQKISLSLPYKVDKRYPINEILFFDIETTGFSADISSIYLIGCLYYHNGMFHMTQWFADDYHSEKAILQSFFSKLSEFKYLIHYNGTGFDLPYIKRKCELLNLPAAFDQIVSIDLMRVIKPYKEMLRLANLKQKTVEQFLQIARKDQYNGGELISVYGDYIKSKFKQLDTDSYLAPLLLHNKEDLIGMTMLTALFHYSDIMEEEHTLLTKEATQETLRLTFLLSHSFESPLMVNDSSFELMVQKDQLTLTFPIYQGELKYFYPDYQNYYYLFSEDEAIHKSVAEYVDKSNRRKAKACNCYKRVSGSFLRQPPNVTAPVFYPDYKSKEAYLLMTEAFFKDEQVLIKYAKSWLRR